ncbi:hypothetical protein V3C41_00060 [Paenarthrobacter nicotinovorans]|uniref:Uncharacterized protein n=1 Tax=Paenarthrobacter nicotinovorans TaxID=29320 RepID=A0ABV0GLN9_PAENI
MSKVFTAALALCAAMGAVVAPASASVAAAPTSASASVAAAPISATAADIYDKFGGPQFGKVTKTCSPSNAAGVVNGEWASPPTALEGLEIVFHTPGVSTIKKPAAGKSATIGYHQHWVNPTIGIEAYFSYKGERISGISTVTVRGCGAGDINVNNHDVPANLMYEKAISAARVANGAEVVVPTKTFELPYRLVFKVDGVSKGETYKGSTSGAISKTSDGAGKTTLRLKDFGLTDRNVSVYVALPNVQESKWPELGSWNLPDSGPAAPTGVVRVSDRDINVLVPASTVNSEYRLAYYINDEIYLGDTYKGRRYAGTVTGSPVSLAGSTAKVNFVWWNSRPQAKLNVYWVNGKPGDNITQKTLLGSWDIPR